MNPQQVREMLEQTLADRKLSRGEKTQLNRIFEHLQPDPRELAHYRSLAFDLARSTIDAINGTLVVEWLEDITKLLLPNESSAAAETTAEAWFSPRDDCPRKIRSLIAAARNSIDVCVFTITDDRLAESLIEAHQRRVKIRIVTDDEKSGDLGSDADRLQDAGIALRLDRSRFHMHHKFAIFDQQLLLNGSYNWTRGAAEQNEENFTVTGDGRLLSQFQATFDSLWEQLGTPPSKRT